MYIFLDLENKLVSDHATAVLHSTHLQTVA